MHATARPLPIDARPSPERFVLALGAALHREGIPAHRLESALTEMGRRLDLRGQYFSTPTSLYAAFGPDGDQRLSLIRVDPGELHLEKLSQLDQVTKVVLAGELHTDEATARIDQIVDAPDRYGPLLSSPAGAAEPAPAPSGPPRRARRSPHRPLSCSAAAGPRSEPPWPWAPRWDCCW